MQLQGNAITHVKFGKGVVTKMDGNIITVCFSQGEKRFLYPDSFSQFLILKDKKAQKRIEDILYQKEREEEQLKRALQEEQDRIRRLRNLKISPNSQAAFGFVENTEELVFSTWNVFTGRYLSGYSKGEPRIPSRLKPNSACLLTKLPKGAPEKDRRIIGVFMVQDTFSGDLCKNGQIKAHEDFRIKLSEKEQPKFWRYFQDTECPASWGKTEIKYFSNEIMQKILYDISNLLAESAHQKAASEFYQYFCEVNRLGAIADSSVT